MRQTRAALRGVNDAKVGLVGNEPRHIVCGQLIAFHHFKTDVGHVGHRCFEYGLSILVDEVLLGIHGVMAGRSQRTACRHAQEVATCPVGVELAVHDAAFIVLLQKHGTGPVAKQHASRTVGVVNDGAHFVRADNDDILSRTVFHTSLRA